MAFMEEEFGHLRIPFEDIKLATNNFADGNVIGAGAYGKVYRGELLGQEGFVTVACKRLTCGLGGLEFWKEFMSLFKYRHANLVSVIGFCDESGEKIIIDEYLQHGSLDKYLNSSELTWSKRLQIAVEAARGLSYLHNPQGTQRTVVHRDIKSANILLDEGWHAKISDFGLSKILPVNSQFTYPLTSAAGTYGYLDPLYMETGILSKKSDIYSFGVVLLEVLCGKQAVMDNKQFLGPLASRHYERGSIAEIIDPILREQMNLDSLNSFSAIAYQCLLRDGKQRPTMRQIVSVLEQALEHQQEFEKGFSFRQVDIMDHMKIGLADIRLATNDFDDAYTIGYGGHEKVYKAELLHMGEHREKFWGNRKTKSTVAIKRLTHTYGQETEEFLQEISMLSCLRHPNLVKLIGYCVEDHERILLYEYAPNGRLEEHIRRANGRSTLTWNQRLQICLGAARGLEYLHNGAGAHHSIIHGDMKSSSILLGQSWKGMISDFGLSITRPHNLEPNFLMSQITGTLEYIDPQYNKTGLLTKASDVYSFGVVLYEVLCGRLARFQKSKDNPEFVPNMAKNYFEQKKVNEIIDPKIKKEFEKAGSSIVDDETCPVSLSKFAAIAYECILEKREDRPTMSHIVKELEKALECHVNGVEALRISLDTIRFATNDFCNLIKKGESGMVYKGELPHSKGHDTVIVKRFYHTQGSDKESFYNEIAALSRFSHKNIVPLLGFCEEEGETIVVFEHMANGSLKDHLKTTSLTWKQRLKICVDAAHGLAYIHTGAGTQYSFHGDVKSGNILLHRDWEAFVSDFIISEGRLRKYNPLYTRSSNLPQKSDVYDFGLLLFEILSGRSTTEDHVRWENKDGHEIFLPQLAARFFKNKRLEEIIFRDIKGQIDPKSLVMFSKTAYQCLQEQRVDRPTMADVVKELETALQCQDEWEWEQKLPREYEKIIKMSKVTVTNASTNKLLYSLLSSGILLQDGKLWISIGMDGATNEMISAKKFSYKNGSSVKWRSIQKSRFLSVAKISDISKLDIKIKIKTHFLTPKIMYGAHLVFKFCDQRKVSSRPIYVNLKYKKAGETLNAYFAEWKAGQKWLTVEMFRFWNDKETTDFEIMLESFSLYYCGRGGIFVEGIEFQAIRNDDIYLQGLSKSKLDMDKGEKLLSPCKLNGWKCPRLSARAVVQDHPHLKHFHSKMTSAQSRYNEVVEIPSYHEFRIKCDIETQMLSSDTTYACFLVFGLSEKCRGLKCPVKARDMLLYKKERTKIISFTSPSKVNLDKIKWIPKRRDDGWMEVIVWETIFDKRHADLSIPMDLKLISFEGTMSGLIVCGIEFRPI